MEKTAQDAWVMFNPKSKKSRKKMRRMLQDYAVEYFLTQISWLKQERFWPKLCEARLRCLGQRVPTSPSVVGRRTTARLSTRSQAGIDADVDAVLLPVYCSESPVLLVYLRSTIQQLDGRTTSAGSARPLRTRG